MYEIPDSHEVSLPVDFLQVDFLEGLM
jgi:hypothetical protein